MSSWGFDDDRRRSPGEILVIGIITILMIPIISRVTDLSEMRKDTSEAQALERIREEGREEGRRIVELKRKESKQAQKASQTQEESQVQETVQTTVAFRSRMSCEEHYEKHGIEMGFSTPEEYEQAAAAVVLNADSLHKLEEEDGDDVYYLEKTNEFVIVSTDGYIRTYFYPSDGIDYFNRQ